MLLPSYTFPNTHTNAVYNATQSTLLKKKPLTLIRRSGQQILLGDRVIVKGERPGEVATD